MTSDQPQDNEIEVSLFGPGFGECACVHLGSGRWIVVDSCRRQKLADPVALTYLKSIGVDPAASVELVIATHWHDDHIAGLADVVEACSGASIVCSSALLEKEFLAFVYDQSVVGGRLGSGVDEFRRVLEYARLKKRVIRWAKANVPLHPIPPGSSPSVVALSPSDGTFGKSLRAVAMSLYADHAVGRRRLVAPGGPNDVSVVVHIRAFGEAVVLGADLEESGDVNCGWTAVVNEARQPELAGAVKIPHHGSSGSHSDAMWEKLLHENPLALLTPYRKGNRSLPTDSDLKRLSGLSKRLYITVPPDKLLKRNKKYRDAEKVSGVKLSELSGWGHVRARYSASTCEWRVDLEGDATSVHV